MASKAKPPRVLAIDPGERHCGMAWFIDGKCTQAIERLPGECIIQVRLDLEVRAIDVLVVEEYRLYPWKAAQQAFSQIKTIEVIGVLRYLFAIHGTDAMTWVEQGASIKEPTQGILRAKGLKKRAKGSQHALDAELHGYYYLMNRDKEGK